MTRTMFTVEVTEKPGALLRRVLALSEGWMNSPCSAPMVRSSML